MIIRNNNIELSNLDVRAHAKNLSTTYRSIFQSEMSCRSKQPFLSLCTNTKTSQDTYDDKVNEQKTRTIRFAMDQKLRNESKHKDRSMRQPGRDGLTIVEPDAFNPLTSKIQESRESSNRPPKDS